MDDPLSVQVCSCSYPFIVLKLSSAYCFSGCKRSTKLSSPSPFYGGETRWEARGVTGLQWIRRQERPNLSCPDLALHIIAIKMGIVNQDDDWWGGWKWWRWRLPGCSEWLYIARGLGGSDRVGSSIPPTSPHHFQSRHRVLRHKLLDLNHQMCIDGIYQIFCTNHYHLNVNQNTLLQSKD